MSFFSVTRRAVAQGHICVAMTYDWHNPSNEEDREANNRSLHNMCHRALLLSQRRLVAAAGHVRHLNHLMMTTQRQNTKQSYRQVNTHVKRVDKQAAEAPPELPTNRQLFSYAVKCAIPMIGFGFMVSISLYESALMLFYNTTNIDLRFLHLQDNTIMIHAGHYIDCTLGVKFSLSTLAAAGIGQILSGIGGVLFGDTLETLFREASGGRVDKHKLSTVQKAMRSSRIAGVTGGIIGVTLGCTLGLVNLLFVDEEKANMLKLQALEEGQEFEFEVEVDNVIHPGLTTVIVRGPDVDGVLASITATIASNGCSIVKLDAGLRGDGATVLEDMFIIRNRATGRAVNNDELGDLARTILAAARDPLNTHSLKGQIDSLEVENIALAERILMLESNLENRQIKIVKDGNDKGKE